MDSMASEKTTAERVRAYAPNLAAMSRKPTMIAARAARRSRAYVLGSGMREIVRDANDLEFVGIDCNFAVLLTNSI